MIAAAFSAVKLVWKMQQYAAYAFIFKHKSDKPFWACTQFSDSKSLEPSRF
jgi:hypothetical protein